jgi:hypothetical protein
MIKSLPLQILAILLGDIDCWGSKNGGGCRSGRWEVEEKDPGGGGVRSLSWRQATSEFPRDNSVTVNRN